MHLTESHMHAFTRITHVCIYQNHTGMHLTESHMYAFNRIRHALLNAYMCDSVKCIHV